MELHTVNVKIFKFFHLIQLYNKFTLKKKREKKKEKTFCVYIPPDINFTLPSNFHLRVHPLQTPNTHYRVVLTHLTCMCRRPIRPKKPRHAPEEKPLPSPLYLSLSLLHTTLTHTHTCATLVDIKKRRIERTRERERPACTPTPPLFCTRKSHASERDEGERR